MSDQQPAGGGYKKNWVKYLVIYLVVAAVAYAVIYFVFIKDGSGGGY
jgi:flagellar basal body-associated protein FliL